MASGHDERTGDDMARNERAHRNLRAWETTIAANRRAIDAELEAKLAEPSAPEPERQDR